MPFLVVRGRRMLKTLLSRWQGVLQVLRPPKIVIYAPNYTHLHSGVRGLHALCDHLNRLGVSAAVTAGVVDPRSNTPRINRLILRLVPSIADRSIVIYPEITMGNPLRAKHVVRYLLNKPGFFIGRGVEAYGASDYFIHFAEEFRPDGLKSRLLRLPLVDTRVFTAPSPRSERDGFLVYSNRYRPDLGSFPDWVGHPTVISRESPRDPPTLANLYRRSRALIVGERTSAITEALHCHCPVILLPHSEFAHQPVISFYGGCGLALGFDRDEVVRATDEAASFPAIYATKHQHVDARILEFVADAANAFALPGFQDAARQVRS
jgi:hypothetical protein